MQTCNIVPVSVITQKYIEGYYMFYMCSLLAVVFGQVGGKRSGFGKHTPGYEKQATTYIERAGQRYRNASSTFHSFLIAFLFTFAIR